VPQKDETRRTTVHTRKQPKPPPTSTPTTAPTTTTPARPATIRLTTSRGAPTTHARIAVAGVDVAYRYSRAAVVWAPRVVGFGRAYEESEAVLADAAASATRGQQRLDVVV
jgi:hypothetical protein